LAVLLVLGPTGLISCPALYLSTRGANRTFGRQAIGYCIYNNLSNTIPAFGEKHREKGIQTEENLYGAGLRKALDARVGNNRQAEVQGSQEPTHLVLPLYLSSSFSPHIRLA